jgi:hypothetical protein
MAIISSNPLYDHAGLNEAAYNTKTTDQRADLVGVTKKIDPH